MFITPFPVALFLAFILTLLLAVGFRGQPWGGRHRLFLSDRHSGALRGRRLTRNLGPSAQGEAPAPFGPGFADIPEEQRTS